MNSFTFVTLNEMRHSMFLEIEKLATFLNVGIDQTEIFRILCGKLLCHFYAKTL